MTTPDEPLIDYYKSATSASASATTTLTDLIEAIAGGDFADKIDKLRATLAAGDDDGYSVAKRDLPAVSVSGICEGKRAQAMEEGRFNHSGYLQLDFDAVDNIGWDVEEIVELLQADSRMVAAFISPSGHGVKGIARIPVCQTRDEHVAAFVAARRVFAARNLVIDEACKDPVRLMFVSNDPLAWIDLSRTAMFEGGEAAPELPATQPKAKSGLVIRGTAHTFPQPPQHGIHTWLMEAAWHCRFNDMTEQETAERLVSYDGRLRRPLQPTEAVDAARQVFSKPMPESGDDWKAGAQVRAAMAGSSNSTATSYDPADVFYDQPAGKYLIQVANTYHTHGKQAPVMTGLTRALAKTQDWDSPKALREAVMAALRSRELDGGVQWSGSIAGHPQGMMNDCDGRPMLIISEPITPDPASGECPTIMDLLDQAFVDPDALATFISWTAGRYRAVRAHTHIPSPMLVLAGEVNSGKSLLAWIVAQLLGGRTANPYTAWNGGILWNDDLVGAELLLVDDCSASTDIRARRNFGAAFKEAMYPHIVQLRKRHSSSVSVRPVWAVIVCCNDTPEALQIIPPLDADMSDKVILLHVSPIRIPADTSTPEGRADFQRLLKTELPAFAGVLHEWVTPEHLRDSRSGVLAWRDGELLDAVDANSPARRLEALIETATAHQGIWHDLPREFTALEIESRLTEPGSPVRDQAKAIFTWHGACGSALARLAKMGRERITLGTYDADRKVNRYFVRR